MIQRIKEWWRGSLKPTSGGRIAQLDHSIVKEQDALVDAMYIMLTTSRAVTIGPRKREELNELYRQHRALRHVRWPTLGPPPPPKSVQPERHPFL